MLDIILVLSVSSSTYKEIINVSATSVEKTTKPKVKGYLIDPGIKQHMTSREKFSRFSKFYDRPKIHLEEILPLVSYMGCPFKHLAR